MAKSWGIVCCVLAAVFLPITILVITQQMKRNSGEIDIVAFAIGAMIWPVGFLILGLWLLNKKPAPSDYRHRADRPRRYRAAEDDRQAAYDDDQDYRDDRRRRGRDSADSRDIRRAEERP